MLRLSLLPGCTFVFVSFLITCQAQVTPAWVARYDSGLMDEVWAVEVDASGNVYVGGMSINPNGSGGNLITVKYDASGNRLWSSQYGIAGNPSFARGLALDAAGNVYLVGTVFDTNGADIATIKYSAAGVEQWVRRFDGGANDYAAAVTVDGSGNVCVAGSVGAPDYSSAYVLLKYDSAGDLLWSRTYAGEVGFSANAAAVAVDTVGNVYVTGDAANTHAERIAATLKYDANGNLVWIGTYPTTLFFTTTARGLQVDASGNVYVGGTATGTGGGDFLALKYTSSGALSWAATYDGGALGSDYVNDLRVDSGGNVYLVGTSSGTAADIVLVKFDSSGTRQWVSRYNGPGNSADVPTGLSVDAGGDIFVGGASYGAGSQYDFVALRYDANGNLNWVARYDNAGNEDYVNDMARGSGQNIVLAGYTFGSAPRDFLTVKYIATETPGRPQIVTPPQDRSVVIGGPATNAEFSVTATGPGTLSYQWRFNGRDILSATSSNLQISSVQKGDEGEYSVLVRNAAGETATPEARLTVHTLPSIAYLFPTNETMVEGKSVTFYVGANGDALFTYQWQQDGIDLAGQTNFSLKLPLVRTNDSGLYRVIVTNPYGQAISAPVRLTVLPRTMIDRWTWRYPVPQGNDLQAIAFGNGRFVAVGEGGAIISSADGTNWASSHFDVEHLNDVAYGNGLFVAVSSTYAFTSSDGLTWTLRRLPWRYGDSTLAVSIAYGGGVFVATGYGIFVSSNGLDWIDRTGDLQSFFSSVTYGNDRFVASAYGPTPATYVSTNGMDWVGSTDLTFSLYNLAFGNGLFVGSYNNVLSVSADGLQWSPQMILDNTVIYALAFANGQFLGLGQEIVSSPDGSNWTKRLNAPGAVFADAAFGNGVTVVVGDGGNILTSYDSAAWNWISSGTDNNLRGIAYANGRFVAVGNEGAVWVSLDGRSWTNRANIGTNNLRAIAFGQGLFVAAGEGGTLLSSADGFNWQAESVLTNDFYGLVFANNRFMAVGNQGRIAVSTNGHDWLATSGGTTRRLQGITYGAGRYVATGQGGTRAASLDATNWTAATVTGTYLEALIYTNGWFVGVGAGGIYASADGDYWEVRAPTPELESIIYAEGMFIVGGDHGVVYTSTNGVDWVRRDTPVAKSLRQLIYARGSVWAVGNNEAILQSGQFRPYLRIVSQSRTPPSPMLVTVRGEPGKVIRIEGSNNLRDWDTVTTWPVGPDDTLSLALVGGEQRRLYRALTP